MRGIAVWKSRIWRWANESRPLHHTLAFLLHGYLLIVGTIGFFALISAFPSVRIVAFTIEGNSALADDEIVRVIEENLAHPFAWIVGRDVPLWAPHDRVAASIYAMNSRVHDVTVSGRFSRTLSVHITEEVPSMLWCGSQVPTSTSLGDGDCWYANDRGTIYAPAPTYLEAPYPKFYTTPAPIFSDPYPRAHDYPSGYLIADRTTMEHLASLSDALPERGYQVLAIGVTKDADVIVFTKEGTRFLFALSRNILEDMRRLEALREALRVKNDGKPLSEVDLRFTTKIYFH